MSRFGGQVIRPAQSTSRFGGQVLAPPEPTGDQTPGPPMYEDQDQEPHPIDMPAYDPMEGANRQNKNKGVEAITQFGSAIPRLIVRAATTIAPETMRPIGQRMDEYYGTPQSVVGEIAQVAGQAPLALLPGGPAVLAGTYGLAGAGGVREDIAARREAGEDISGWKEFAAAVGTGGVNALAGFAGGKLFQAAGGLLGKSLPALGKVAAEEGVPAAEAMVRKLLQEAGIAATGSADLALNAFASNLVKKLTYAPEQPLGEGVASAAVTGLVATPAIRALHGAVHGGAIKPLPEEQGRGKTTERPAVRETNAAGETVETAPREERRVVPPTKTEEVSTENVAGADRLAALDKAVNEPAKGAGKVRPKTITKDEVRAMAGEGVDQEALDQLLKDEPHVQVRVSASDFAEPPRQNLSREKIEKYAAMPAETAPPILAAANDDGTLRIADGRHRLLAAAQRAKDAGEDPMQAKVRAVVPESWAQEKGLIPKPAKRAPNETVRSQAAEYVKDAGLPEIRPPTNEKVDVGRAEKIAEAYDTATHDPNDPAVKSAYDAFKKETLDQWIFLKRKGVRMEPWAKEGQPYKNSAEMQADIRDNKHLYFFRGGDIPADHPLSEVAIEGVNQAHWTAMGGDPKAWRDRSLTYNDVFRAVHDYFGHAKEGNQFGPRGEENAWVQHSQMYSPEARKAMTTETRGQNSWINFGPHGEANRANPANTKYAEQKAAILPAEFHGAGGEEPPKASPATPPGPSPDDFRGTNPIDLPAQVIPKASPDQPVRARTGPDALLRAFEDTAAKRPGEYVAQRDRLQGTKTLAIVDVTRNATRPLDRITEDLGINLEDRAVQFQITEALRGHADPSTLPAPIRDWVAEQRKTIDNEVEKPIVEAARALGMDDFAEAVEMRMGTFLAVQPIKRAGRTIPSGGSRERLPPEMGHFRRDRYVITDGNGKVAGTAKTAGEAESLMESLKAERSGRAAWLTVYDPIPVEWRKANEVHDPRFLVGKTMVEGIHLREMLRLLKVSQPYVQEPVKGLTPKQEVQWAKDSGLGKLTEDRRLGPLAGKYLPVRMAEDFNSSMHIPSDMERLWLSYNSVYKVAKTAFNPATSGHNIISNAYFFATLDGVSPTNPLNWKFYKEAAAEVFGKKGEDWRGAVEANFIGAGGRYAGELQGIFENASDYDAYVQSSLKKMLKAGATGVQDFYGAQDDVYKLAAIKEKMANRGMSHEEAVAETRKWWPDYSRASKIARWLRNAPLGASFITFTDQAVRISGRAAREKPVMLAALAAAPIMLNAMSKAWLGLKKDDPEAKMVTDEHTWAEPLLPVRDANGRLQTWDMRYIIPLANDILPEQKNGMLKVPFIGNTPVASAFLEQGSGRERFTGRTFVTDQMSLGQNLAARGKQLAKTLAPVPSVATYGVTDVREAAAGQSERILSHSILNQLTGINIRTPYIAEKNVAKIARNMILTGDVDQAESLVNLWNEKYKPGNQEDITLKGMFTGARQSVTYQMDNALKQAASSMLGGKTKDAIQIMREYNAGRQSDLGEIDIHDVEAEVEKMRLRGRRR